MDLSPLKNIEHIGDGFLYSHKQKAIDFSPLKKLKTIGKNFLRENPNIEIIDLSSLIHLSEIGDHFAHRCGNLQTVIFNPSTLQTQQEYSVVTLPFLVTPICLLM